MEEKSPHDRHEKTPITFPALPSPMKSFILQKHEDYAETINYSKSYSLSVLPIRKRRKPQRWSEQETQTFYTCLEIYGVDFRMMLTVLRPRTIRQIERKYHKEKKRFPTAVDRALSVHESNKITFEPNKKINCLEDFLNHSIDSDQMSNEASDDSLDEVVRHKLKLQLESTASLSGEADEPILPLDFYMDLSWPAGFPRADD